VITRIGPGVHVSKHMDPNLLKKQAQPYFAIRVENSGMRVQARPRPCTDCSDLVTNRTVSYALQLDSKGQQTWQRRCSECRTKTTVNHPFRDAENK
jgi:hypothetical protein